MVNFGEIHEDDEIIDILYALANGLLHNVSLTSYDKFKNKYYIFRYNAEVEAVCKNEELDWDGNYETLDGDRERFTTHINVEKFRDLVFSCIQKAVDLNHASNLILKLDGGVRQLFYDYIKAIPKE